MKVFFCGGRGDLTNNSTYENRADALNVLEPRIIGFMLLLD